MLEKRGENKQLADSFDTGSKKLLGESIQRKIAYYLTKSKVLDSDLYLVVKDFFTEMLGITQEITCKELKSELNKIYMDGITREKLDLFLDRVSLIEYKDEPYSDEDLRRLLHEFEYLVDAIIKASRRGEKKGFFATLFGGGHKKEIKSEEIPNRGTDEILKSLEKVDTDLNKNEKDKKSDNQDDPPQAPPPEIKEEPEDEKTKKVLEELASINTSDILPKDMDSESWTDNVDLKKKKSEEEPKKQDDWAEEKNTKKTKEKSAKEVKKKKEKKQEEIKEDILSLIKNANKLKEKQKLKEEYKKINKIYESLSDEEKSQYFEDVHEIYDKIQSL